MTEDRSYGVIPFRVVDGTPFFLMVWERWGKGHIGFPKGHPEPRESRKSKESRKKTARRELFEETGLRPRRFLKMKPLVHRYTFWHQGQITKIVEYFVALMGEEEPRPQEDEIGYCRWMTLEEILVATPYPELKDLATRAHRAVMQYQQG